MATKAKPAAAETHRNDNNNGASAARYDVFVVNDYEHRNEKRADWIRVGVAFPLKERDGFKIKLHATPVNGELVVLAHEPKPDDAG